MFGLKRATTECFKTEEQCSAEVASLKNESCFEQEKLPRNKKRFFGCRRFVSALVLAALVGAVVLARIVGVSPFCVLSGSMESSIPTGSLIFTVPVKAESLEIGDVITFKNQSGTVVTHRIVEVEETEDPPSKSELSILQFRTKGDANACPDGGCVYSQDVIGKPVLCVPCFGYVVFFLQSPLGLFVVCFGFGLWILAAFLLPQIMTKFQISPWRESRL